jgi:hypothetical protein
MIYRKEDEDNYLESIKGKIKKTDDHDRKIEEPQKVKAKCYLQRFTLYNAVNSTELEQVPMNFFNSGRMISKYIENF